ncbi:MAG TPA: tetratricopeptide repeat protein [Anaerolineaceae bacterium]|nr:tetratricopeptide repeat protein [Anaerolineaceae bacterium]
MISKRILPWLIVALLGFGCTVFSLPLPIAIGPSPTPTQTPTSTATLTPTPSPTPTSSPTPLPEVRVEIGEHAMQVGDYAQAASEYQAALDSSNEEEVMAAALLGMGRLQFLQGNAAAALDSLRAVVERYPNSSRRAPAYFYLGETYRKLGRYPEAADAYQNYLKLRPGLIDSYVQELRGDSLAAAQDYNGAIGAYQAAVNSPRLKPVLPVLLKIGQATANQGDFQASINQYTAVLNGASDDYTKAQADFLIGQAYLHLGKTEDAYNVFLDAVTNYPRSFDSYSALVALVNAGVPVNELYRGLVDYFAGKYNLAVEAFDRFIAVTPDHDATPLYYKGLALRALGNYEGAIANWDIVIQKYTADRFWESAWEDKADTQWGYQSDPAAAARTLLDFVAAAPDSANAPDLLFQAARNLERDGQLDQAAAAWEKHADQYPSNPQSFRSLFLAAICRYRQSNWTEAKTTFQRALLLATNVSDQSAAQFWIGKLDQKMGDPDGAGIAFQVAAGLDPTGYYSERARDLLVQRNPFDPPVAYDLAYDLNSERADAEKWLRSTFSIASDINLDDLGPLKQDARTIRGAEFWGLGLYDAARSEFESLRQEYSADPANLFRLVNYYYDNGLYRSAILGARQILTIAGLDDAASLNAPAYFNHLRFGTYFRDLILPAARQEDFSPLFLFSVVRQESLFEGFVESVAGARGLMQIMPATGQSVANSLGWPDNFTPDDLYRPVISVRLGAHYLAQQLAAFDGDLYAALASYNGGPGNAQAWKDLSDGDPDLFLEVIRIQESRDYVMRIYELYTIYRRIYARNP